jgi:hypothetical protein
MVLGIVMAASKNHGQHVTHAHIMLAGSVVSFMYGLCHKLWLNNTESKLAKIQFYMHQFGVAFLSLGLFLLYGQYASEATIEPVLSISSLLVLGGMILMKVLFIKNSKS